MCYSTTKGTARKKMAFPGVVKPFPWPGLQQVNSQFHSGPLWNHHHHHHHRHHGGLPPGERIHNTSGTTHFKVLPTVSQSLYNSVVKDITSPAGIPQSPVTDSRSTVNPVSANESVLPSSPIKLNSPSNPPGGVVGIGTNDVVMRKTHHNGLSQMSAAKKKRIRRKRCGSCVGCTRKENCGMCTVCTNSNATNSVCKFKRCDVLKHRNSLCNSPDLLPTRTNVYSPQAFGAESLFSDNNVPLLSSSSSVVGLGTPQQQLLSSGLSPLKEESREFNMQLPEKKKRKTNSQPYKPQAKPHPCGCPGSDEGNYYTHLGAGLNSIELRATMEKRFSVTGKQLRMLEVTFSGMEAKTSDGCPTAEWIIRRESKEELFLVIYRHHKGHVCNEPYTVISIVLWDGLSKARSMQIYKQMIDLLPKYGMPTQRRCERNETKSCACQGKDEHTRGCSYSFGCSWSVYYNGCKFAKSKIPRKFKLTDQSQEGILEDTFQTLATDLAPVYKWLAPVSFSNQTSTQDLGQECRLGYNDERPFSGVTCCMDFCAHSHYDRHNMTDGGATVVCTILKEGMSDRPPREDGSEQLHVLPLYRLTDPPEKSIPGVEVRPVESSSLYESSSARQAPPPSFSVPTKGWNLPANGIPPKHVNGLHPQLSRLYSNSVSSPTSHPTSCSSPSFPPCINRIPSSLPLKEATRQTTISSSSLLHSSSPCTSLPSNLNLTVTSQVEVSGGAFPKSFHKEHIFHNNRTHDLHTPEAHKLHNQPFFQNTAAKFNGRTVLNTAPPDGHHHHHHNHNHTLGITSTSSLHQDASSSSNTDSDSDCNLLISDSPTPSQPSPVLRPVSLVPGHAFPPTKSGLIPQPVRLNGLHVKSEAMDGSSNTTMNENGRMKNGFSLSHQVSESPLPSYRIPSMRGSNIDMQNLQANVLSPTLHGDGMVGKTPEFFGSGSVLQPSCDDDHADLDEEKEEELKHVTSDRLHAIPGGVAMALGHGSILIECAKKELHATTAIANPCRSMPTRLSMVFYQHKRLILRHHGWCEEEIKAKKRLELQQKQKLEKAQEEMINNSRMVQFNPPLVSGLPSGIFKRLPLNEYPLPPPPLAPLPSNSYNEMTSDSSDSLDILYSLLMDDSDSNECRVSLVPRAIPLSEIDSPFYLELPIKKVDITEEANFQLPSGGGSQQILRFSPSSGYVSAPTLCTPTLSTSSCKPKDVFSGMYTSHVP